MSGGQHVRSDRRSTAVFSVEADKFVNRGFVTMDRRKAKRTVERILTGLLIATGIAFAVSFVGFGYATFLDAPGLIDLAGFLLTRTGFVLVAGFAVLSLSSSPDR